MQKCLILGSSGLIGSHLVDKLRNEKYEIFLTSRDPDIVKEQKKNIYLDLDEDFNYEALPSQIDTVIYLAQSENFREFPDKALNIFKVNILGLQKILDYALKAGAKKFIYASSGGIYGNVKEYFSEDMVINSCNNLGYYLSSKLCGEILADNYSSYFDIVTIRFFFVYGPGQNKSMLIPRLVNNILAKNPVILQGEKGIKINPTYVSDAVNAIEKAMQIKGSHKINVAGPSVLSIKEIAELIGDNLNVKPIFEKNSEVTNDMVADISKMSDLLHNPCINFKNGIKMYIESLNV